jgi:nicotinate-nucleotide pyrophosphorylase (carboxylating)
MTAELHDPIAIALAEDLGPGDVTSRYFVPAELRAVGRIVAREPAVVAGLDTAAEVFRRVDAQLSVELLRADGAQIQRDDVVLQICGAARSILTAERVALNFLQRLSGIATLTRQFVDAIAGTQAKILDTRKTTPGLRILDKAAVAAGGGTNHRFGLSDMVLVKDNHLAATSAVDLSQRIAKIRAELPGMRIEVEADTLEQVREFLALDIDVILLDNMDVTTMGQAVAMRGERRVQFEASGGVTLQTVHAIAKTGVDFISVGALTHSAPAVDFSLELTHDAA